MLRNASIIERASPQKEEIFTNQSSTSKLTIIIDAKSNGQPLWKTVIIIETPIGHIIFFNRLADNVHKIT